MAVQLSPVPFKLTPQDMGKADLIEALSKGQQLGQNAIMFPQDLRAKQLANAIQQVNANYAEPMAQGNLTQLNQQNQWNPKIWQSEIGLRGAQAGLMGQEAKYYGPKAEAEIGLQNAQASNQGTQAQQNALKLQYLKQVLGGASPSEAGNPGFQSNGSPSSESNMRNGDEVRSINTQYGIPIPQPSREDIVNKMILGTDSFGPKQQAAKEQVMNEYKNYQGEIAKSVEEANAAQSFNQALSVFNNAMDKSYYKGSTLGELPSSGWKTALIKGDLSAEQQADKAASQMLPDAIGTLKSAMGSAKFSNLDMNMASKLKFDRAMNDETRQTQTTWIGAVNNRMLEKAKFYAMMGNPKSGAQKTQADMLFQEYNNNFPLINAKGDKVMTENLGNWPLYTTPKAIRSIQETGTYTPSSAERSTFMMRTPTGELVPVKKGKVEAAIKRGFILP